MKAILVAVNSKFVHTNLAVHCLHAYAVSKGLGDHISIQEYTINQSLDDILAGIYEAKPDMIAFSCYLWNCEVIQKLLPILHELDPKAKIWLGGPEVSYQQELYYSRFPFLAGIMSGEGEEQLVTILNYYLSGQEDPDGLKAQLADIPSLSMDDLPFPYADLSALSHRILYYESSRGCPFSCSYCLSGVDHCLRFRSLELVTADLQRFLDAKVPQVKFVDRTFNCKESHTLGIWNYLLTHDNGITNFHFEIAADLLTENMLRTLEHFRPGAVQLEIGVQSTNPDTLDAIRRRTDIAKIHKVVQRIRQMNNIHCHLDLIAGLPYEDYETFHRSFNEVYAMQPHQLQLGFLKLLSGSYMAKEKDRFEILFRSYPPYEVLRTKWISYDELLKLKWVEEMVDVYYNSAQFHHTLDYCIPAFDDAFSFYYELGRFYHEHFLPGQAFKRMDRYGILADFMKHRGLASYELCERMTLDIYLREPVKNPPDFVHVAPECAERIRDLRKEKGLGKLEIIHPFSKTLCRLFDYTPQEDWGYIYFDYEHRDPITYNAAIYFC